MIHKHNLPNIKSGTNVDDNKSVVILLDSTGATESLTSYLTDEECKFVGGLTKEQFPVSFNKLGTQTIVCLIPSEAENYKQTEKLRVAGYQAFKIISAAKLDKVQILANKGAEISVAEGLALSAYDFAGYKTKDKEDKNFEITVVNSDSDKVSEIQNTTEAVFFARDIVNEPQSYLTAPKLSEELEDQCKQCGIEFTRFDKDKIVELKMGGLLGVNRGSLVPPTFNILEYKPANAKNKQPLVLVGKGVVYDTGGLSLKPTPNSMDIMKCDMGGSATVSGAIFAIAKNKLPYHVITLIPATDNRPGGDAYAPGDVLTMYNGSTVEVWNTDAEGRLIMADALAYAQQYKPELVIDAATLTGAAMRAIGKEAIVMMSTASEEVTGELLSAGRNTYERLVEFPLWEEYMDSLKSDIADIRNLGGANAGAITAGKFLETFTDYPWIHMDIAAPAFLSAEDKYRSKNATGVGVRLIYDFVKNRCNG